MRIDKKIFNHKIEFDTSARCSYRQIRKYSEEYYTHLTWGRFSLIYGQPHLEPVRVCSECLEAIEVKNAGDEWWDYCEGCHQVEGKTHEITMEEYENR